MLFLEINFGIVIASAIPAAAKQAKAIAIPATGIDPAAFLPVSSKTPVVKFAFSFFCNAKLAFRFSRRAWNPETTNPIIPGIVDKLLFKSFDTPKASF